MKKYFFILPLLYILSAPVSSQIGFKGQSSQLPSKKTTFEAVEIGDVTNDGLNDIIVGSGYYFDDIYDYSIFIYKQNSDGTLATPIKIAYPKSYPGLRDIELGDFNNDKLNDIAICYGSTVGIFYQLPTGGFSAISTITGLYYNNGIKSGDLNNDGLTDIVGYESETYKLFLQKPSGGFTLSSIPSKTLYCSQLEVGDLNGDNLNDIAKIYGSRIEIIYQKNGVSITKDSSSIINSPAGSNLSFVGLTIGDLNNDGRNDLAVAYGGNSGRLNIYYQTSNGKLDTDNIKTISTYDIPTPMEIADLNCDGLNEIIIGHSGWNKISVFSKSATMDYGSYSLFPGMYDYTPFSMAVGDINSDLKPDVISVGQNATLSILYNNSKPLTFDSIKQEIVDFPLKRDTTDTKTVAYIPIQDTALYCMRNDFVRRSTVQTYANEHYSGDSLSIRYGMMCSSYCDTVKTAFAFTKIFLLKTVVTDSIVSFDTLTTKTDYFGISSIKSSVSLSIHSNTCWNVSVDVDWIKPSVYAGTGDAEFMIEMDENLATIPRSATITLSGDRVPPIRITVFQWAGEPFVFSHTSIVVLSEKVNNTAIIEIISNTSWKISKDFDWLSFDKTMGTGNELLIIHGALNETGVDRMGSFAIVFNENEPIIIPVMQLKKGTDSVVNPSKSEIQIYPNPTQKKLIVESNNSIF